MQNDDRKEELEEDEEVIEEDEDDSSGDNDGSSTKKRKSPVAKNKKPATEAKKSRAAPASLDRLLAPLDAASLSKLLLQVCARSVAEQVAVSNEQFVRQQVGGALSLVAVDSRIADAEACFKKIWSAFPHTRYGSDRDHFCYKRVRPVQAIFIKKVSEPLVDLKEAKNWRALLRYLRGAVKLALDLPSWDQAADNKSKAALYKRLAAALRIALRSEAGKTEDRKVWKDLLTDAPAEFEACVKLLG